MTDNSWNISKIFWGLMLILIGALLLADNFGLVHVNFANILRLWPLFIVAAGLSMLALNNMAGRIIMIILSLLTLGAVAWAMLVNYPNVTIRTYETTIRKTSSGVKQVEVSVKAGASTLQVGTVKGDNIAELKFESNIATLVESSKIIGDSQFISLAMDTNKGNGWMMGDTRNVWKINLTKDLPLTLNIDAGASSADIDTSGSALKAMIIKTGASSMSVKLGDKQDVTSLVIESGVSSIVVKVPKGSGVHVKLDNGLTSNSLDGLVKVGDNTYESLGYGQSKKQINITSKIGLSSFTIERY